MRITLITTSTTAGDQGLRTISSMLKSKGHFVRVLFLTASEDYSQFYSRKTLAQVRAICRDSDWIGFSSMTSTSKRAVQVINYLKPLNKLIVWGGIHATLSPESCIKHADVVCVGEGEEAVAELADKLSSALKKSKNKNLKEIFPKVNIDKIKNLWINKNGKIIRNPVRPLLVTLDKLPFPDYEIKEHYILKKNHLVKFSEQDFNGYIFFLTGRGCPYCCTYCSNKALNNIYHNTWGRVRWHSPDYIINGILFLKKKYPSLKIFDIRDDTFSLRPIEQIREFCDRYKKEVRLRMKCLGDPRTISEEKIRLLVDAGCTDIIIGIQGSERVNKDIYQRPQKDEDVINAARILNKFRGRLAVMYDVITSNPYESGKDVLNLIHLIEKLPPPFYLSVNNLVFFTGSELYNRAVKDGLIKNEKDSAIELNYWDRWKHVKLKKTNMYLNLVFNLMRGSVSSSRFGLMPRFVLKFMTKPSVVRFNERNLVPTYILGNLVGFSDALREKVAKPVYRSLPINFKVWYDRFRYRV